MMGPEILVGSCRRDLLYLGWSPERVEARRKPLRGSIVSAPRPDQAAAQRRAPEIAREARETIKAREREVRRAGEAAQRLARQTEKEAREAIKAQKREAQRAEEAARREQIEIEVEARLRAMNEEDEEDYRLFVDRIWNAPNIIRADVSLQRVDGVAVNHAFNRSCLAETVASMSTSSKTVNVKPMWRDRHRWLARRPKGEQRRRSAPSWSAEFRQRKPSATSRRRLRSRLRSRRRTGPCPGEGGRW